MAEETTTVRTDDLERSYGRRVEGADRYFFSHDGVNYQIDLTAANKATLDELLQPYLDAATKLDDRGQRRTATVSGSKRTGSRKRGNDRNREQGQVIREWAAKNGYKDLAPRGRIPNTIKQAYLDSLVQERDEEPALAG